jgi:hypothetical protein
MALNGDGLVSQNTNWAVANPVEEYQRKVPRGQHDE